MMLSNNGRWGVTCHMLCDTYYVTHNTIPFGMTNDIEKKYDVQQKISLLVKHVMYYILHIAPTHGYDTYLFQVGRVHIPHLVQLGVADFTEK